MWLPESRRCGARGWTLCAISTFPSHCSRSSDKFCSTFFVCHISHSLGRESATEDPEQFMNCYLNPLSLLVLLTVDASSAETLQSIITSSKTLAMEFTNFLTGFLFLIWFFKLGFLWKQIWCGYAVCVSALLTFGLVATQQHLAKKYSSTNALKLPEVLWKWAAR